MPPNDISKLHFPSINRYRPPVDEVPELATVTASRDPIFEIAPAKAVPAGWKGKKVTAKEYADANLNIEFWREFNYEGETPDTGNGEQFSGEVDNNAARRSNRIESAGVDGGTEETSSDSRIPNQMTSSTSYQGSSSGFVTATDKTFREELEKSSLHEHAIQKIYKQNGDGSQYRTLWQSEKQRQRQWDIDNLSFRPGDTRGDRTRQLRQKGRFKQQRVLSEESLRLDEATTAAREAAVAANRLDDICALDETLAGTGAHLSAMYNQRPVSTYRERDSAPNDFTSPELPPYRTSRMATGPEESNRDPTLIPDLSRLLQQSWNRPVAHQRNIPESSIYGASNQSMELPRPTQWASVASRESQTYVPPAQQASPYIMQPAPTNSDYSRQTHHYSQSPYTSSLPQPSPAPYPSSLQYDAAENNPQVPSPSIDLNHNLLPATWDSNPRVSSRARPPPPPSYPPSYLQDYSPYYPDESANPYDTPRHAQEPPDILHNELLAFFRSEFEQNGADRYALVYGNEALLEAIRRGDLAAIAKARMLLGMP